MKVTHAKPVVVREPQLQANNRSSDRTQAGVGAAEKVSVSKEARDRMGIDLDGIREALERLPDVREDKVAAIRDAIQAGTYHPPADAVTEKMIRSSLDDALARK